MANYFDIAHQAQKNVEGDRLDVFVCGSTFKEGEIYYPTKELKEHLSSLNYNAHLAENNPDGDEYFPENLPAKVTTMAHQCNVVVLLVAPYGGAATELSIMASVFPEKTIFCVRKEDCGKLGDMIEGWLAPSNILRFDYENQEQLFDMVHEELRKRKLLIRMRNTLKGKFVGM